MLTTLDHTLQAKNHMGTTDPMRMLTTNVLTYTAQWKLTIVSLLTFKTNDTVTLYQLDCAVAKL